MRIAPSIKKNTHFNKTIKQKKIFFLNQLKLGIGGNLNIIGNIILNKFLVLIMQICTNINIFIFKTCKHKCQTNILNFKFKFKIQIGREIYKC